MIWQCTWMTHQSWVKIIFREYGVDHDSERIHHLYDDALVLYHPLFDKTVEK